MDDKKKGFDTKIQGEEDGYYCLLSGSKNVQYLLR